MINETSSADQKVSPMMAQWHACKKAAPTALLFFRMGDFYEAFYDDAVVIARELSLTLTKRQEIPMAGVPYHASEGYIDRLVGKGFRVAIAEQMEDPKKTKGLVKREVVRTVTPGTVVNSSLLSDKTNNYFASVIQLGQIYGLALVDLTTGEFRVCELESLRDLQNECHRFQPAEILTSQSFKNKNSAFFEDLKLSYSLLVSPIDDWHFDHQLTFSFLTDHFQVHSLDGFGLKGAVAGINAAGALLHYIQDNLNLSVDHVRQLQLYHTTQFMALDHSTRSHLELTTSLQDGSRHHTLLGILDQTITPMGGRLLSHWVKQPLMPVDQIVDRQEAIAEFVQHTSQLDRFRSLLEGVRDLERLMMKVSSGYASPRDLVALRFSLEPIPHLRACLDAFVAPLVKSHASTLVALPEVTHRIATAIVEEPPVRLGEGRVFHEGFHAELDELRIISRDSKGWIARYQTQIREETGIKTLKVGYNRMFGYYIEVSRGQAENMPSTFERRQTLVNAERYITPELKEYESKVLTAEERIAELENSLFTALRTEIAQYAPQVMQIATSLAVCDGIQSLAEVARRHAYVRPTVDTSSILYIKGGRHPVIEAANLGEKFVPNDTLLDGELNRQFIITGPNMAGKSTYIRQVALITIMAQIGSFVPAEAAHIGVVDKVFTRIGASDDLSRGQSTFMVEMTETANILHNATERSLVILDEIGRGTSTYDGIAIAWAVAEYLLTSPGKTAKTLFATHYWELTDLAHRIPGAVNYHVAVQEIEDRVIFLRKIIKGATDKSYGIHVGCLAGLPQPVISRAREILAHLEDTGSRKNAFDANPLKKLPAARVGKGQNEVQLLLFEPPKRGATKSDNNVVAALNKVDVDSITPLQAHAKLAELKAMLGKN